MSWLLLNPLDNFNLSQIKNGRERELKSKLQTAEESPLNTQLLSFLNNKYIEMILSLVSTEELPHTIFQSGFVHIVSFGLKISLSGRFPISVCQVVGWGVVVFVGWGVVVFEWEGSPCSPAFEYSVSSWWDCFRKCALPGGSMSLGVDLESLKVHVCCLSPAL